MPSDDNLGILTQGIFDHLNLLEGLSVDDELFLCGFIDKANGFGFTVGTLDDSKLLLLGSLKIAGCQ